MEDNSRKFGLHNIEQFGENSKTPVSTGIPLLFSLGYKKSVEFVLSRLHSTSLDLDCTNPTDIICKSGKERSSVIHKADI